MSELILLWNDNGSNQSYWNDILQPTDLDLISQLSVIIGSIQSHHGSDRLVWLVDKGPFSSKALMQHMVTGALTFNNEPRIWSLIWCLKVPPKIRIFLWKTRWGALPTKYFLHSRMAAVNPNCLKCGNKEETLNHLFWGCEAAMWVWTFIAKWWSLEKNFRILDRFSIENLMFLQGTSVVSKIWHTIVAAAVWSIWLSRNDLVFQSKTTRHPILLHLVFTRISKWGEVSN